MLRLALKMLFGDSAKYLMLVAGLAVATFLMAQQTAVFCGLMSWTKSTLKNVPAPIWVVEDRVAADPIVNLRVAFLVGSSADPPGLEGLTALTARLMAEATADLDAAALDDALFPMAAELSVQVDKDSTVFVGRVQRITRRRSSRSSAT